MGFDWLTLYCSYLLYLIGCANDTGTNVETAWIYFACYGEQA